MTQKVIGGIYRVVEGGENYTTGEILILCYDDGSTVPKFQNKRGRREWFPLRQLEYLGVIRSAL